MIRTDLAMEAAQLWRETQGRADGPEGVDTAEEEWEGFPATRVTVRTPEGARAVGKPEGTYLTLFLNGLLRREDGAFPRGAAAIARGIRELLPPTGEKSCALVIGLGNRAITPDAVGPKAADHVLATRHLKGESLPLRPVAVLSAGVLGTTGLESGEVTAAVAAKIRPGVVLAVDALAARSLDRLCTTVQIADTGITPGSGVGNRRRALNEETLGVKVIAIGVPTVVDGDTLAHDLCHGSAPEERPTGEGLMVTPKDIDMHVADLAKVIGYGIDLALQPGLTVEDLDMLLS